MKPTEPSVPTPPAGRALPGIVLALAAVLLALFARSFEAGQILFSSDGPLGANAAAYAALPGAFAGMWQDLNWVGGYVGSAFPSLTYFLLWALGPLWFAKLYAPVSLFVLGFSAWLFCRQLGFRPVVSLLAGLAAALNSDFFSYACWGLGTHALAVASTFLALAALATPATKRDWLKGALAGAATGMAVMEGFDSGAILSLYVAAFALFQAWHRPGAPARRLLAGVSRTTLVAVAAGLVAAQALTVLIGTQIQGVAGMQQDQKTKAQRWDEATTWSLPKIETLRTVIAGLYGYRMETPNGGNYWGRVGEMPSHAELQPRHSGAGHYAGVPVVVLAFYAFFQSLRRKGSAFTETERRFVWFWAAAALISLLLAWGRHAPFYQLVYALPFFSTIRNPIKFLHPFSLSLVVLFAYGAEALWRAQVAKAADSVQSLKARFKTAWAAATAFDRRWLTGLILALGASLLGWLLYASSRRELEAYLAKAVSPDQAPAIASFSLIETGWFVLFLALTVAVLALVFSGALAGKRARWAGIGLGLLLVLDLARANRPWIVYWNFDDKYAANPVFDALRQNANEHRVAVLPLQINRELALLQQLYQVEWLQNAFRYFNIQALDVVQDPRPSIDNGIFRTNFQSQGAAGLLRLWQLTNTRYFLGLSGLSEAWLNPQLDPVQKRFRDFLPFGLIQDKPGGAIQVVTNTPGPFAVIEFTGALPRAKLYAHWQILTNGTDTLQRLADPAFDPNQTVLLAPVDGLPTPAGSTNAPAGTVTFASYAPKRVTLKTQSDAPTILLLNDKFDPHWTVTVDGAPQPLLRANFLMQGVALPAGAHTVEFAFHVSLLPLWVSLAGLAVTLALVGWLGWERRAARATVA